MNNNIYFRRASKVIVNGASDDALFNFAEVASLDANLRKLGYALDASLAERLVHAPVDEIKRLHDVLVQEAKEIKGVRRYSPMYPNFPKQVMEASEAELYINAIIHYFGTATGLRIMPAYDKLARPELNFDESKVTLISWGGYDDYNNMFISLMSSKSAFSETDKADLSTLKVIPELVAYAFEVASFDNRENKAWIAARLIQNKAGYHCIRFDTATDVLRLAVAMSDGDVSLADNTRFRNFKRSERRILMGLLSEVKGDITEDMMRHQVAWKRLGERLHPGEFKQYPTVQRAFAVVRDNEAFESLNARVEQSIVSGNSVKASQILSARPGEFARRLDKVLRMATPTAQTKVLSDFRAVAEQVSPTVLLQARNAFINRYGSGVRAFFPKGSVAKMQSIKDERGYLSDNIIAEVVAIMDEALAKQFGARDDLGGAWVDPALKRIAIPFAQRNASKSIKTVGRGSRLALGSDANVIRFFIWWKNAASGGWGYGAHTDIDLSAAMFDSQFNFKDNITFYALKSEGAVHSGDITSAPNGASEFIDIDINMLRQRGIRYVAMTLHSYSGQNLSELPECFAGFMERRDLGSGEVYDPRTVSDKLDLTADSRGATPFIFDLETREAVWVDLSMQINGSYSTVASTKGQVAGTVEAMTNLTPPNLYDLFAAHAMARGGMVSKDKATTTFSFDGDITPFDTETILSEYV